MPNKDVCGRILTISLLNGVVNMPMPTAAAHLLHGSVNNKHKCV